MSPITSPVIDTDRLSLRRFTAEDCDAAAAFLGDFDVAKMMASIAHPYGANDFLAWFAQHEAWFAAGANFPLAITLPGTGLIGAVGLHARDDGAYEFGYWIGRPHWGQGFATEAGHALLGWFAALRPEARIKASHFDENPKSGRVLTKLGFTYTGEQLALYSLARGHAVTSLAMIYMPEPQPPH